MNMVWRTAYGYVKMETSIKKKKDTSTDKHWIGLRC